jgi:hypothetical protein
MNIDTSCFTPGTTYVFDDGFDASADLCIEICRQLEVILPAVDPDASYTLEQLAGAAYWDPLTTHQRQLRGRVMTHLWTAGVMPFERVGCRHEFPRKYRPRP